MRALLALPVAIALAGCYASPTEIPEWPVTVVPAAGQPNRVVAVPPECGPAPTTVKKLSGTSWHNPYLGLGCSQARNFAVQAEEPRDLLGGRPLGPADAEREGLAIQRYRKGEEKDLMREGTRSSFGSGEGGNGG
ncbi:MAG TPA: CpaD family pilus assembly lipoprotein [Azospirillum sp.]|nr:CpaD family pilus assembly lipoprotein [Azospirillum sp.]